MCPIHSNWSISSHLRVFCPKTFRRQNIEKLNGRRETHSRRPMGGLMAVVCVCCGRKSRRPPPGEVNLEKESGEMSGQVCCTRCCRLQHRLKDAASLVISILKQTKMKKEVLFKFCITLTHLLHLRWSRDVSVDCHWSVLYGTV